MTCEDVERVAIASDADVVRVRQIVRTAATKAGLSLVDQTKLITAASELARNTLIHGKGRGGDGRARRRGAPRAVCGSASWTKVPASPTSTWRCRTAGRAAPASGSGCPDRGASWTASTIESEVDRGTTVRIVKWGR